MSTRARYRPWFWEPPEDPCGPGKTGEVGEAVVFRWLSPVHLFEYPGDAEMLRKAMTGSPP